MNEEGLAGLSVNISPQVLAVNGELVQLRRDLHRHPELSTREYQTQRTVLDHLAASGIEAHSIGDTGAYGIIRGRSTGKVLLLRADMDALPITEQNDVAYRSESPGVMHACGHDAHTSMLLIAGRLLAQQGLKAGIVKLLFQPAEEDGNGAKAMIDAGILENPEVNGSLAFHVWSGFEIGTVAALDGAAMASADSFRITVTGCGVHAAMPESGVDPILAAAHIVAALQSLVSRNTSPHARAVVSVASIHGGDSFNIIPEAVELKGTIRTFDPVVRDKIKAGLVRVAARVAEGLSARAEVEYVEGNDAVVNDPATAQLLRRIAGGVVGERGLITPDPLMPAEDIGLIQQRVPGVMAFLGCGSTDGGSYSHHHPRFDIDERVLPIGVEILLRFVGEYLR